MSDELLQRAWRTQCWLSAIGDYEHRNDLKVSAETVGDLITEIERLRAIVDPQTITHNPPLGLDDQDAYTREDRR